MIPPFDDSGFLPPGVHSATLAEIRGRFGGPSEIRRAQMDSIGWMIDLAARGPRGDPTDYFERQLRDQYNGAERCRLRIAANEGHD
jgi:hypothetical protein